MEGMFERRGLRNWWVDGWMTGWEKEEGVMHALWKVMEKEIISGKWTDLDG